MCETECHDIEISLCYKESHSGEGTQSLFLFRVGSHFNDLNWKITEYAAKKMKQAPYSST